MTDYQYPATLPVTTTGGWARPGWFDILDRAGLSPSGALDDRFGPADRRELLDDYCQLAIRDQEDAGLDILTDGEHRRGGWIEGLTGSMPGLRMRPAPRKLGAIGWDQLPVYEVTRPLDDVASIWDFTSEYEFLKARTTRRPKIGMPGPYGITTELDFSPVYATRRQCADALVPAIRSDIQKLVAAGCDYIQIEEPLTPSHAAEDRTPENLVEVINQVVDGITGCTFVVHICFGSFRRLPYAKRTYRWLFPALLDANVHGFSLEFGAREMAEIDLAGKWDRDRILSAGLIDIKTHYSETPDDIIERVRACLQYRDPDKLEISTDCGLRRVPRYLAISKLSAAAAAARRLRQTG
jgi:5-methyltetrahydropteroyltriglutamate--homocysteine methyltransferase